MSKRFIVEEKNITLQEESVLVRGEEVHHINVLRYKIGDKVYINNYEIKIERINKEELEGKIIGNLPEKGIPNVDITLIQAYLKSDKMDYVVQKAVELGVKSIKPVMSKNTIVKLDSKDRIKKVERLNKIAKEAVEQCGRTDSVMVENIEELSKVDLNIYEAILVCHEKSSVSLKDTLLKVKDKTKIAVIVGPEGGLDDAEVDKILQNTNVNEISLGERILRAETASLNILSIIGYEFS